MLSKAKIKQATLLDYSIVLLVLTLSASWLANRATDLIQFLFYGILIALIFLKKPSINPLSSRLIIISIIVFVVQVFLALAKGAGVELLKYYTISTFKVCLGLSVLLSFYKQERTLLLIFYKTIKFLIFSSLLIYILTAYLKLTLPSIDIPEFMLENKMHLIFDTTKQIKCDMLVSCHYSTLLSFGERGISGHQNLALRNSGIFWEPGMYAFFSVLGLGLATYYKESVATKLLYVLAIATSLAPGGFLMLALFVLLSLIPIAHKSFVWSLSIATLLITIASLISHVLLPVLLSLFDRTLSTDPSFLLRSIDLTLPFTATLNSRPFLGFNSIEEFRDISVSLFSTESNGITNSIGAIVFYNGYFFSVLYLFLFLIAFSDNTDKSSVLLPLATTMLIFTSYQPIFYSPIFSLLIALCYYNSRSTSTPELKRNMHSCVY